jgi:hypothetical protein
MKLAFRVPVVVMIVEIVDAAKNAVVKLDASKDCVTMLPLLIDCGYNAFVKRVPVLKVGT